MPDQQFERLSCVPIPIRHAWHERLEHAAEVAGKLHWVLCEQLPQSQNGI